MSEKDKRKIKCSFCGATQSPLNMIVNGPDVNICSNCVRLCQELLNQEMNDLSNYTSNQENDFADSFDLPKPHQLKEKLDEYVIGQDAAKKALCVAVYNHYKRIRDNKKRNEEADDDSEPYLEGISDEIRNTELSKSNVLLIGPTGVGKTYLAQTLARILNVPFAIADATSLTEAGYVGEDVENILLRLIQAADGDISRAERGIIFVDEIDKISRKTENVSITRDVSGEGVQQALLKILEGTIAQVPPNGGRKHPTQEYLKIDTTNILFICSGAFDGLAKIIENRMGKSTIGFTGKIVSEKNFEDKDLLSKVEPQDLLRFGLIPEFIGRVPTVVTLEPLGIPELVNILTKPKNALLKQYIKLLSLDGVVLEFDEDAVESIAKLAMERKTGARGLRAIVEKVMQDVMFNVPSEGNVKRCIVTKQTVEMNLPPLLERIEEE